MPAAGVNVIASLARAYVPPVVPAVAPVDNHDAGFTSDSVAPGPAALAGRYRRNAPAPSVSALSQDAAPHAEARRRTRTPGTPLSPACAAPSFATPPPE